MNLRLVCLLLTLSLVACAKDSDSSPREQPAKLTLLDRLKSGDPDPMLEAKSAADVGDFRFFWYESLGGEGPLGFECRTPARHFRTDARPLMLSSIHYSDQGGSCPNWDAARDDCAAAAKAEAFGSAYNRALIAHPRFPYPDLCPATFQRSAAHGLSYAELIVPGPLIDTPRNLGEAVRRGSLGAVDTWIARASPEEVNREDDFGFTPLSWAVIQGRMDVGRRLIAAGADPLAENVTPYVDTDPRRTPLHLAIELRRADLVRAMVTPELRQRIGVWPFTFLYEAVRANNRDLVRTILKDEHADSNVYGLLGTAKTSAMRSVLREEADPEELEQARMIASERKAQGRPTFGLLDD